MSGSKPKAAPGSGPSAKHIDPALPEDVDKVLLIRLYPEAAGLTDAATKAMAQGEETGLAGEDWESSQYEPVLGTEPDVPPPPPPARSGPPTPQREA